MSAVGLHEVKLDNSTIRNRVVDMYKDFVSEVDPRQILDLLIQKRIVSFETKEEILSRRTKSDRCRALLDQLFYCSHDRAFIVLRDALKENYSWILQRIDTGANTSEAKPLKPATPVKPVKTRVNPNEDSASNHAYASVEEKGFECMKSALEDSSGSTNLTAQMDWKAKFMEANNRIKQLELEVSHYQMHNASLIKQLSVLQSNYDETLDQVQRQNKKIGASCDDLVIYENVDSVLAGSSLKPFMNESTNVTSGSSCIPPPPPPRPKNIEQGNEVRAFEDKRPEFVKEIKGSEALRGMAMMDDILYVVRLGSILVEMYDGKENYREIKRAISLIPKDKNSKMRFLPTFTSKHRSKAPVSSGIQDIACCHRSKRLYASDWQLRRIHCVSTSKREVVCSWPVEAGEPWGISVTSNGNIVVSCESSGQLCEYTSDGNLLRTVKLKVSDEGPWHALLFGTEFWIFCHGGRYYAEGCVSISDIDGGYVDGYNDVDLIGPSHLALLPDKRILVVECDRNRVVMLEPSLSGPVREILNPDHGITMPVRLHYCDASRQLIVGLHNGSVFIYGI